MLTDKELETLKEKLEVSKGKLEKEITELKTPPEFGSDVDSMEEESDESEEFSTNMGTADALKRRLAFVNTALDKMAEGAYGKCEKCGKDLSFELLSIAPESTICKECKLKLRE